MTHLLFLVVYYLVTVVYYPVATLDSVTDSVIDLVDYPFLMYIFFMYI